MLTSKREGIEPGGPVETYRAIVADLDRRATNAAERGKPLMWAYYTELRQRLVDEYSDVTEVDGGYAGASLALSQIAVERAPKLSPMKAAQMWAIGVYARRILEAWGVGKMPVSLEWMRERAAVTRP